MATIEITAREQRLLAAYFEGAEEEMVRIRGRGLTPAEREEFEDKFFAEVLPGLPA